MARTPAAVRRTELVDAAIRVALTEGLEAATVRRIAKEAGVSLGTVHYCFGSKRALLEAVVESVTQPSLEVDLTGVDADDYVGLINAAFRAYWLEAGGNSDRQRLIYELVTHLVRQEDPGPEQARTMFRNAFATVERFIRETFGDKVAALPLAPDVLARMTIAMTDGVALAWIAERDDEKALEVFDGYATLLGTLLAAGLKDS
ncbi:TetR/AcrR family transcriptional regulator [Calidifontibacter terrae]